MNVNLLTTSFHLNDQYLIRFLNDNNQPDATIGNGDITLRKSNFNFQPAQGSIDDFDADLQFFDGKFVLSTDQLIFDGKVNAVNGDEQIGEISFKGKVNKAEI